MDVGAAIGAGILAGAVMGALLYMGIAIMPTQMRMNLFFLLGSMVFRQGAIVYIAGAMVHGVLSIVFGLLHVALYQAFGLEASLAAWGLLFGFGHYLIVGMALGMMPVMHPRIRAGDLQAPGFYALGYPKATAVGFLMLHLVYGLLVGVLYGVWA